MITFKNYLKESLTTKEDIQRLLDSYGILPSNAIISADLSVELKYSGWFCPHGKEMNSSGKRFGEIIGDSVKDRLPVKFTKVKTHFNVYANDLTTLEGCPVYVGGDFSCADNHRLSSLEYLPKFIAQNLDIGGTNISSLTGIEAYTFQHLRASWANITEGGIGLILVPRLIKMVGTRESPMTKPFKIISTYLGRPDDIFECQAELIEQGFEEFAQL